MKKVVAYASAFLLSSEHKSMICCESLTPLTIGRGVTYLITGVV